MDQERDIISNLILELRRGTLILSVLSQMKQAKYGYALVQNMSDKGVCIDPNTLYPLLRRLEKQGLLCSEWNTEEAKPRKYYRRTEYGNRIYQELKEQWIQISLNVESLLKEE